MSRADRRAASAAARPRRARRWLLGIGALLLALGLLLIGGWLWLFHSHSGRDFALAQLSASLPTLADGQPAISYEKADGVLADTLILSGLRYRMDDGTRLEVDRVELRLSPTALLGRRLQVESLSLAHPLLRLGEAPAEPPPESPALQWPDLKLPLSVAIAELRLDDGDIVNASGDVLFHLRTLASSAELDRLGHLAIGHLTLDSDYGRLDSRGDADFDGIASGQLTVDWHGPGKQPPLQLRASARDGELALTLSASGQPAQRVALQVAGERWQLHSELDRLDLRPWWPDAPVAWLSAQLKVDGAGRQATLSGQLASDVYALQLLESTLELNAEATAIELAPLVIEPRPSALDPSAAGRLTIRGQLALDSGAAHQLSLRAEALSLPGTTTDTGDHGGDAMRISGDARLSGPIDAWSLAFDGSARQGELRLPIRLQADGDLAGATLHQLAAGDAGGRIQGSGRMSWSPAVSLHLQLALDDFDPSRLHPEIRGRLDGDIALDVRQSDADWRVDLAVDALRGNLLGHAIRGDGDVHLGPGAAPSRLHVLLGESDLRLLSQGGEDDRLNLQLALAPLRLQDLLADSSGELRGSIELQGPLENPTIHASLQGETLQQGELRVGRLALEGEATPAGDAPADLRLTLRDVSQSEARFDTVAATLSGRNVAHRIELQARGEPLGLSLRVSGGWQAPVWRGVIEEASVAPAERPVWHLQQPAELRIDHGQVTLSRSCLKGQTVSLCAEASGNLQQQSARIDLQSLPLALIGPWLPRQAGEALDIGGDISGNAHIERVGEQLQAELELDSRDGHVNYAVSDNERLLQWQSLTLHARLAEGRVDASLDGRVEDQGRISAQLSGGSPLDHPDAAIQGRLQLHLPQLRALSLVEPELSDASARLDGDLAISGSWQAPRLTGSLLLDALNAEIPALGIKLSDSRLRLDSDNGSDFRISGELHSGEGALRISGRIDPFAAGERGELQFKGERVLASDTSLLHILVSPDLRLGWHAEHGMRLDGRIGIPEGRLNLERIENSIAPSSDVVVADPRPGRGEAGSLPVQADLSIELGEAMRLRGFGFDGRVEGTLALRERPGRSPTGRGTLTVSGKYQAYGQNLDIQRGRLLFASSALDNPSLDVRAEREFDRQTVGLEVRGTALLPILDVYSDPPLDQAEALSYLVLGRPLRQASGEEGAQLGQAATAIGGNLLAGQLGDRIGLDIGVADSKALGGAAVSVGKFLSPRLYLGYGVSLFGSGQVVTFKYIINRLWEAEVESGRENRVGLNYTLER